MPPVTIAEDAPGVSGLTVVCWRRKAMTPAMAEPTPSAAKASATRVRPGTGKESVGAAYVTPSMAPAMMNSTSSGGIFSSSHDCTNAPGLEPPRQIGRGRHVIRPTERRPPGWHARVGDKGGVGEVEDAMSRQREHHQPERPLEPCDGGCDEDQASQRLENQGMV